jgi:7-keto-8-aminopelargonate synthetase-like enzyme
VTAATGIRKLMHGSKLTHLWGELAAVIMPDLERGAAMWEALLTEGLYVNLARPPATPAGMTLLRCSLCTEHSAEEVETILGMFERAGKAVGIV